MSDPLQHYVPKFMLRRFAKTDADVVFAFDKHLEKSFRLSTAKKSKMSVAAERFLYDFEFHGVPMTLEPSLSALETKAAEIASEIDCCWPRWEMRSNCRQLVIRPCRSLKRCSPEVLFDAVLRAWSTSTRCKSLKRSGSSSPARMTLRWCRR